MSLETRIFLGFLQSKELQIHLKQSKKWQEAKTLGSAGLEETLWNENKYIGLFMPPFLNIFQIKENENNIKCQLQLYCPKLNLDRHSVYLISQLFIF